MDSEKSVRGTASVIPSRLRAGSEAKPKDLAPNWSYLSLAAQIPRYARDDNRNA